MQRVFFVERKEIYIHIYIYIIYSNIILYITLIDECLFYDLHIYVPDINIIIPTDHQETSESSYYVMPYYH